MAPTLAWNVDERLSLGVALNLDYQSVAFKQRVMQDAIGGDGIPDTTVQNFDLSRNAQGFGIGASASIYISGAAERASDWHWAFAVCALGPLFSLVLALRILVITLGLVTIFSLRHLATVVRD